MLLPIFPIRALQNLARRLLGLAAILAASSAAANEPIIFIHGYANAPYHWDTMVARFKADGYPGAKLYRYGYNSLVYSNRVSAAGLRDFVDAVRSANGGSPVSLIGHSNGGLVARWYLAKLGGATKVRRFISIGTPHRGSTWAYGCVSPVCYEMRPYSLFLAELNGAACDRSLWSALDGLVFPYTSAQCGSSVRTPDVTHNNLILDAGVYLQVRSLLK
jgi:triacylglycerol lipase